MERIYLSYTGNKTEKGRVRVNVFLKDVENNHKQELRGFLDRQRIRVNEISDSNQRFPVELSYYDDVFEIAYAPQRWSFFEMRDYIRSFLDSWNTDLAFASKYLKQYDKNTPEPEFNDGFYVKLSKAIDHCEDRYYYNNCSISLFMNEILKLLKDNLSLYFASAELLDVNTGKIEYRNYVPQSIPNNDIIKKTAMSDTTPHILKFPLEFNDKNIAEFHLHLSPDSPGVDVVRKFTEYVLEMIDDFIYGDIHLRTETNKLKSQIAILEKELMNYTNCEPVPMLPFPQFNRSTARIIVLGAINNLKKDVLLSILKKYGYNKNNITLDIEYKKLHTNINDLKKIRSKYDGILLGPMPHNSHGDMHKSSLIAMMLNEPDIYPPFVILKSESGNLKITKNSLKKGIVELSDKLEKINQYEDAS